MNRGLGTTCGICKRWLIPNQLRGLSSTWGEHSCSISNYRATVLLSQLARLSGLAEKTGHLTQGHSRKEKERELLGCFSEKQAISDSKVCSHSLSCLAD